MTNSTYRRYIKLGTQGEELPDDAIDYVAVRTKFFDVNTGVIHSLDVTRDTLLCGAVNHADAIKACANLELCGTRDWRLPSIKEMASLVDHDRYDPAIDPIFNCESASYWSSTQHAAYSDYAWGQGFDDGYQFYWIKYGKCRVRAFRSSSI